MWQPGPALCREIARGGSEIWRYSPAHSAHMVTDPTPTPWGAPPRPRATRTRARPSAALSPTCQNLAAKPGQTHNAPRSHFPLLPSAWAARRGSAAWRSAARHCPLHGLPPCPPHTNAGACVVASRPLSFLGTRVPKIAGPLFFFFFFLNPRPM